MQVKFSEDVIPLSDLKINPGKVVGRAQDTHRPILLTSRGRGIAVVQGLEDYERTAEELRFVKAVAGGLWMFARATPYRWRTPRKRWVSSKWNYA